MLSPVSADDWPEIDSWWGTFQQGKPFIFAPSSIRKMPEVARDHHWSTVDTLWDALETDHEWLFADQSIRKLSDDPAEDAWETVDEFWNRYAELQQNDLRELRKLMVELREAWTDGASQFDEDPLSADWRSVSQYEGPLRTTVTEEDWSQWLAHLLRTSSGPFAHELLGTPNRSPNSVRREVVFFGNNSQRRVDILVEYEDIGVSIEVKRGDEHYGKTPETAGLVERRDHRDWAHFLLLQEDKLSRLQQTFGDAIERSADGLATIRSDQSADIDVRHWQDVSRVLRWMLIEGREPDSHWEASAYLFITLIEQRILGLHSFSFVDPASAETAPATDVHRLIAAEPDEQIDYLRAVLAEKSQS
ncbi:hypothetical protein OB920_18590 [Halobacteria archaeon HArc-gm2]|nr:hypothetical protein [Halobacteria archaeon HArc-gm2]